jgi:hypothetical protein
MRRAGFKCRTFLRAPVITAGSIIYWADVGDVRLDRLGPVRGTQLDGYVDDDGRPDWGAAYAELLRSTLEIRMPRYQPVRTTAFEVARVVRTAVQPHT